tara:strand:+ start:583 stop:1848 length:1266 start_codon:yes stop_codon:yes gene_type:complete
MSNFNQKILITFPSFLISLIPFFLITGPFLSDLSVVLVCIFFFINIFINKEYSYFNNKFFLIFFIYFIYLFINSLVEFYDYNNLRSSLGYLRFGIFSLGVIYFIEREEKLLKWTFIVFLICFLLLIFDGYFQYFFKFNIFGDPVDIESYRIRFFFNDEYVLGSYLSRLFPVFLALTFLLFKKKHNFIILISLLFVLIETLIFLSGERVAFFFNTLSAIFIIIMINKFKKIRLITLVLSFFAIISISIFDDTAKQRIWDQTINQIGIKSSKINIFSEIHESHYTSAYKMFLDNKIIGIGIRNFRNFCDEDRYKTHEVSCTSHPHNTYVQLLAETGLIGFSFAIILFFYFIFKMFNHLKGALFKKEYLFNDFQICLLAAILITIWPFAPTGNFFNNWISIIYYFPVGFFLWSLKHKNSVIFKN